MFRLDDKITLVTGAGSGIGESIAKLFAESGAFVGVIDRDQSSAESTSKSIQESGGKSEAFHLDVCDAKACSDLAESLQERFGRIDILVNNAGIGHVGTLLDTETDDLDRMYDVNVKGVFNMTKAVLMDMVGCGKGNIINLASIGGIVAVRDRLAYCTTKFAVVGFTKCIALDHASEGIRCNCICPGRVETPFVKARLAEYPDPEKAYQDMASTQALGRMAKPEEIASAALYLASDESSFVTGTPFLIDGGWSAGK
jgi:NAD(P)-dependent dehydrogenase (short-subunit alcohol dehydrogenase family)